MSIVLDFLRIIKPPIRLNGMGGFAPPLALLALLILSPSVSLAVLPEDVNIFDAINFKKKAPEERNSYFSFGAKYLRWENNSIADNALIQGAAQNATLSIKYDLPIYYQISFGSGLKHKLFRFRYDIEFSFGMQDVKLSRALTGSTTSATEYEAELEVYGLNLSLFYDLPTLFNVLTPYGGASGMLLGLQAKMSDATATALASPNVNDLLGRSRDSGSTRGFNLLYGYGFAGGLRWDLAPWLALDTGYRFVRYEGCIEDVSCGLIRQENIHEARANVVVRF